MSWLYLPEQVAVYLGAGCLDGESCVTSKTTSTASKCSKCVSVKATLTTLPSGITLEHSTGIPGLDWWILSQRGFRVSRGPLRGSEGVVETSVIYGLRRSGSFARYDRDGVCWKTSQGYLPGVMGISDEYLDSWPKSGMTLGGECYLLPELERHISGRGYGLWRTADAGTHRNVARRKRADGSSIQIRLVDQVVNQSYWPTPRAQERQQQNSRDSGMALSRAVRIWLTPRAGNPGSRPNKKGGKVVAEEARKSLGGIPTPLMQKGHLNPAWVEWLMGWPIGWTDLRPLATARFQQWLERHGFR